MDQQVDHKCQEEQFGISMPFHISGNHGNISTACLKGIAVYTSLQHCIITLSMLSIGNCY